MRTKKSKIKSLKRKKEERSLKTMPKPGSRLPLDLILLKSQNVKKRSNVRALKKCLKDYLL